MRVIQHLELRWNEQSLPPDHLAAACDVLAYATVREESVLICELRKRYIDPWCAVASERLAGKADAIACLPDAFAADLPTWPRDEPQASGEGPSDSNK